MGGGVFVEVEGRSGFVNGGGGFDVSVGVDVRSMSKVGSYAEVSSEAWYGSDEVVDLWLKELT